MSPTRGNESTLVLNLRDLSEGHHPFQAADSAAVLDLPEWLDPDGEVTLTGDAERRSDHVIVRGRASLDAVTPCSRCATPVRHTLAAEVFVLADRAGKGDAEEEAALEEEGSIIYHDGMELSLVGAVREALILEEPLGVLCRPDCRGLCPQCGIDLNSESCNCSPPEGDPRWGILKTLTPEDQ